MSGTPTSDTARLPVLLSQLRLPTVALLWPALTETADRESWPAAKTLAALMEHEVAERARRRTARHLLEARLPVGKTLDRFDFAAVSSISKARVTALAEGDSWLDQGTNILLFGPPGVGKSHLAAALGHAMIDAGYRVLFARTTDLVQQLQTARQELKLASAIEKLDKYHLLVLDDLSYVQKSQAETSVIFELISARYERRSLLITANQPFGAWDSIFPDPAMTVAAIDRLVHHSIILEMNTDSYRRKSAEMKLRRKPTGSAVKATLAETFPTTEVS
jgi:DNA replication protein DnaC